MPRAPFEVVVYRYKRDWRKLWLGWKAEKTHRRASYWEEQLLVAHWDALQRGEKIPWLEHPRLVGGRRSPVNGGE